MAWTERDERDHIADSCRCGVCGNPNGMDCEHETCPVCNEELAACTCEEEGGLPAYRPEPLLVLAHPAPLALRR